jgi:hypothetical protein
LNQVVNKAKPTVTWAAPELIQYGTPLGAAQLNAIATTAGTFVYNPAAGKVLAVGKNALSVSFTPTDTADYIATPVTASVSLQVVPATSNTPTVTVVPSSLSIKTTQILPVKITVAGGSGKSIPAGSVFLTSGTYTSESLPLGGGSATIYIPAGSLAVGADILTATYTPDASSGAPYKSATGKSSAVTVTAGVIPAGPAITLAVASGGKAVTTVAAGSIVTLTATVKAGAAPVTTGQVNFCDASGALCTDIHLVGTAQLTKAGTAVVKFRPGAGIHFYKAVFCGNKASASSASAIAKLTVNPLAGLRPTAASIAQTGDMGNYTLTAMVGGKGLTAPVGTIAFLDSSYGNAPLRTAVLTQPRVGLNWTPIQSPVTTDYSSSTAVGDFNGDGIADVAVTGYSSANPSAPDSLLILLGKGDGSFSQLAPIPLTGSNPMSIAVGDFNGDGIQDLAIVDAGVWGNGWAGSVTILLGKGDGTFQAKAASPTNGNNSRATAVGDFNGDGVADLAIVNQGAPNDNGKSSVTILLGKGDGTFTAAAASPAAGTYSSAIAVGDFNGDGKADLAVANQGDGTAVILLGKGDGTFTAGTSASGAGYSSFILAGDFNGDGKTDLVVQGSYGTGTVLLGKGDGTFTPIACPSQDVYPQSVTLGDFNGDGILDLALSGSGSQGFAAAILLGNGDGTFLSAGTTAIGNSAYVASGDFDGDGISDLFTGVQYNGTATALLTQTASATATVSSVSVTGPGPHMVNASYSGDSDYKSSISTPTELYAPTTKPVFSVAQGTYTSVQTVSITDPTPGAKIYVSTNGYPPYTGSDPYLGPITVSSSETLMAVAVVPGFGRSDVASATYTIKLAPAATPVFSIASGVYPSARTVTISAATPGSKIYYTTNGMTPTTDSAPYSGAITVNTPMTLMAIATAPGHSTSAVASAQYLFSTMSASLIYTIAGNGTAGYSGDGGQATTADLNQVSSAVLDRAGNLYIADSTNNRIRKVAATTGIITTYAGIGTPGYSGDKGQATKAQLNFPNRIAIDSADNLYIPDINNFVVRKVTASSGVITTIAGTGIYNQSGCAPSGAAANAQLRTPGGVVVDTTGNVFIADQGCGRIFEIVKSSGNIVTVAGGGSNDSDNIAATAATLRSPHNVVVDGNGNLYIAESSSHKIRKVSLATGKISTVAGNGFGMGTQWGGYTGDGGPATSAELNWPTDVKLDSAGNIYIADMWNNAIRKVTAATGKISTVAGNGFGTLSAQITSAPCGYSGDGGPSASAELCYPSGVTVDGAGNLYISDRGNNALRKVTVSSVPPTATTAAPTFSVSGGTYPAPQLVSITDSTKSASIHITVDGTTPTAASPGYKGPINVSGTITIKAIAIALGYLQSAPVAATYTITSTPGTVITTVAGSGVAGFSRNGGAALNVNLGFLDDVAVDAAGNLYLADGSNNVIWKVTAGSGVTTVVAGNGTPGYWGDQGPAIYAALNHPASVALDNAGNLYIADAHNNEIRKVVANTGVITTIAGNGQCSDTGDGGPGTNASLCYPISVRLDSAGNIYIADAQNNLVRKSGQDYRNHHHGCRR